MQGGQRMKNERGPGGASLLALSPGWAEPGGCGRPGVAFVPGGRRTRSRCAGINVVTGLVQASTLTVDGCVPDRTAVPRPRHMMIAGPRPGLGRPQCAPRRHEASVDDQSVAGAGLRDVHLRSGNPGGARPDRRSPRIRPYRPRCTGYDPITPVVNGHATGARWPRRGGARTILVR